jgi:hypothetical protein
MDTLEKARDTQLRNIQAKTGKTLAELRAVITASGLTKHSEIRTLMMEQFSLGYGDANSLVHYALESDGQSAAAATGATTDDLLAEIYSGPKAALRPIHDRLMTAIEQFGPFEIAAKKGYVSLRRKRQFVMIGPGTNTRVDVGINMKDAEGTARLEVMPPGGMCQYRVKVTEASQVDDELVAWAKRAYDTSG